MQDHTLRRAFFSTRIGRQMPPAGSKGRLQGSGTVDRQLTQRQRQCRCLRLRRCRGLCLAWSTCKHDASGVKTSGQWGHPSTISQQQPREFCCLSYSLCFLQSLEGLVWRLSKVSKADHFEASLSLHPFLPSSSTSAHRPSFPQIYGDEPGAATGFGRVLPTRFRNRSTSKISKIIFTQYKGGLAIVY